MSTDLVTLRDVARAAGVSVSTASKALSGAGRISATTREHVSSIASDLGFRPNALARSFVSGRSQTIGILTHRAANPFTKAIVLAAAAKLGESEHATLIYDARLREDTMRESMRQFRARRIDGLLVVGEAPAHRWRSTTEMLDVPVAYAFLYTDSPDDVVVTSDDHAIGTLAATHLLEQGYRRIAIVTAGADQLDVAARVAGAEETLRGHGIEPVGIRYGDWSSAWGRTAMADLVESHPDLDAVICGNDHIGTGAVRALEAAGRRVRDDVALVGVDNWEDRVIDQDAPHYLTTIDVGLDRIGQTVAEHLIGATLEPGVHRVAPQLVPGTTT